MNHEKNIQKYGRMVEDYDVSPFESLDMLYLRSELQKQLDSLSPEERSLLSKHDYRLLRSAEKMHAHIKGIYDFSKSQEPLSEWWWHLDKLDKGIIMFSAERTDKDIAQ